MLEIPPDAERDGRDEDKDDNGREQDPAEPTPATPTPERGSAGLVAARLTGPAGTLGLDVEVGQRPRPRPVGDRIPTCRRGLRRRCCHGTSRRLAGPHVTDAWTDLLNIG
ncbi:hypothetical protein GCM10009798_32360 [Nocardioides panacihumi]|uniref:Uncharacterized protein n=1 Tax=Nocardioides panacihumi TaxID=400774 RepID=A0ABN2RIG3_9ACTN